VEPKISGHPTLAHVGYSVSSSLRLRARFENLCPSEQHGFLDFVRWKVLERSPQPPPFTPQIVRSPPAKLLELESAVTWIGHSSFFLRLGSRSILLDPVFSEYCAPFPVRRLKRRAPPGLSWESVARPDLVLITHNHYDHLDLPTIRRLPAETQFIVPRGLADWFHKCGRKNVLELGWWDFADLGGLRIRSVPAQHFSSRTLWDRNRTLWCGWVLESANKTVYYAGDTGYCPVFREIGDRFGPMDLSLIPIGSYAPRWFMRPVHINPDEAVQIHIDVRSKLSVACHWGTFCLTDEPMDEPPKLLAQALSAARIPRESFRVLAIGETLEISG
jgi:N-acyl-phosphatidylethanolamine-hydrolysing phospholipase D